MVEEYRLLSDDDLFNVFIEIEDMKIIDSRWGAIEEVICHKIIFMRNVLASMKSQLQLVQNALMNLLNTAVHSLTFNYADVNTDFLHRDLFQ